MRVRPSSSSNNNNIRSRRPLKKLSRGGNKSKISQSKQKQRQTTVQAGKKPLMEGHPGSLPRARYETTSIHCWVPRG